MVCVMEGDVQGLHGSDDGLHGRVDVLVDQLGVVALVLLAVSSSVDDPHLFDEGALTALARAWYTVLGRSRIFL